MDDLMLSEAEKLWKIGGAVHLLRPNSKVPYESGWTSGPRKSWKELYDSYKPGMNLGLRLGSASKINDSGFLSVVDVDIKSKDPKHKKEALERAESLLEGKSAPMVETGRGGGSRHYYCLTPKPFKTVTPYRSLEEIKAFQPSKKPSKRELQILSPKEIGEGIRLVPAWEVSLYSEGRQVVVPPSIHPDTGNLYTWKTPIEKYTDLPLLNFDGIVGQSSVKAQDRAPLNFNFLVEDVDLEWLPISDGVKAAIKDGTGVTDRSGYLLKAVNALLSCELSQNEVLSVLTNPHHWLASCSYEHAKTGDRARAAEWLYRYTFKKVEGDRVAGIAVLKLPPLIPKKLSPEEMESNEEEFREERDWRHGLVRKGKEVLKLVQNVVLILQNEVGASVIERDLFSFQDAYGCNTPWRKKKGEHVVDDDIPAIKHWLGVNYGIEPQSSLIWDSVTLLATKNGFDPVQDSLDALPQWDNIKRLDTWLVDHFSAKGQKEYLAQVFRKWLVAMVMRIYQPGSKFDWMPIFEGEQGIGKSSFGRLLVGEKYFLDWLPDLKDKDSALALQGIWGVELGELSQFKKNELETIKAFLTRTVDKVRPPFGRKTLVVPRRCVFFGTTNRGQYLIDSTGNRRFKPVVVGNLDFDALKRDRLQLFAEAKYLWDNKIETESSLEITGKAKLFESSIHQEKMVEDDADSMEIRMRDFIEKIDKKEVTFDLQKFKLQDLFAGVGPLAIWRFENKNIQFALKMLRKLGAKYRFVHGIKFWKLEEIEEKNDFL